tara:strand:+ start:5551 stop:5862 length:312 start_codon:yes stop_codon:yes gene_type:complete
MDTAEDLQQIARFNSEIMTQEEMKQIYSQQYDEIKKLKEEIKQLKEEPKQTYLNYLQLNKYKADALIRIIGENWGEMFKEAFEMVGAKEELIECGIVTEEDFE